MAGPVKTFLIPVSLGLLSLLSACQKGPPRTPPAPSVAEMAPVPALARPPAEVKPPPVPASINSIDDYKAVVAQQILDANSTITFSGRLPPMLPAIVVVNISVDRDGELSSVVVKRSRDPEASKVALAAIKRVSEPFPRPVHLLKRSHKTLDFSETFLFNDRYHFQLRSLAGPQ